MTAHIERRMARRPSLHHTETMRLGTNMGITRYARSFYELLGNRRKFVRTPMANPIFATTKGFAVDLTRDCSCIDISPRGVGIECPEALVVDSFVFLHTDWEGPRRMARVRYCLPRGDSFRIGLEFVANPADAVRQ
jgi:PilZ domain-containing protein